MSEFTQTRQAVICIISCFTRIMNSVVATKIEEFFNQYRLRHYAKGQVLILNGDDPAHVFYLVNGRVKQYDVSYRGDEIILNVFKPPAFFPMSLAINKVPNPYIFEAETDIDIRQAPAADAVQFLHDNPDVTFDLLSRLYRGTDGLLARMVQLMSGTAKSRLMLEIQLACQRFGTPADNGSCTLSLNESDLAARAGLTRETVSREMSKLTKDGLLSLDGGAIIVHNLETFEQKLRDTY